MAVNRGALVGVVVLSLIASMLLVPTSASAQASGPKITKLSTQAGPVAGGTTVTVNGSGFVKVAKVLFGRTAGSAVKVASTGRLTVRAPKAAAGTVDVRVVVKKGSSLRTSPVTKADRFTYYAAPAVTSVAPSSGGTAGGTRVTVKGRNFVRVTKVVFGSTKATKVSVTDSGKLVATSPAHAKGTVDVRVYGAFGTSAVVKADRFRYDAPKPVAPVAARGYTATPTAITVHFVPPSDFDDVVIRRATGTEPPATATAGTAVADTDSDADQWEDTDLQPGTRYAYAIFARDSNGRYSTGTAILTRTLAAGTNLDWSKAESVFERQYGEISGVSCVSATFCAALDRYGSTFFYDGTAWSSGDALGATARYNFYPAIACASPTLCLAADGSTKVYRFDGTTWTGSDVLDGQTPTALSCASATFCMAATGEGGAASFDGTHWSKVVTASPVFDGSYSRIESLSCPSAMFCTAIDVSGRAVRYDGSKWSKPTVVGDNGSSGSVSCASATSCLAVLSVSNAPLASWNGTKWTAVTNVPDGFYPEVVACSTASSCQVRGGFQTRTYDGQSWSEPDYIQTYSSGSNDALTCTKESFCVATTTNGLSVRPAGETWNEPDDVDVPGGGLQNVSCTSGPFCLAVDTGGKTKTYRGTSWTDAASLDTVPSGLTCVSSTFCLAISYESAMVFDGSAWSPVTAVTDAQPQRVTCASTTLCVADDENGNSWIYNGSTWRKKVIPIEYVSNIDCVPGGARCVAVGGSFDGDDTAPSQSSTFDGTQWSKSITVGAGSVSGLSCVTSTFCVTSIDEDLLRFDGTGWSRWNRLGAPIYDVACTSTVSCVALTGDGGSTFDGETWSTPRAITDDPDDTPGQLVCADASLCFGIAEGALLYRAP